MNNDPLLQLIDSGMTLSTYEAVRDFALLALTAPEYDRVLNRFKVKSITHGKDDTSMPHHDVLIIQITDAEAPIDSDGSHLLSLERTSSNTWAPAETSSLTSISRSREGLGYQPITDSPNFSFFTDASALASTSAISVSGAYLAIDMFGGGKSIHLYTKSIRNVR